MKASILTVFLFSLLVLTSGCQDRFKAVMDAQFNTTLSAKKDISGDYDSPPWSHQKLWRELDHCKQSSGTFEDECVFKMARDAKLMAGCERITGRFTKQKCLIYFAVENRDHIVCGIFNDIQVRNSCYSQVAVRATDISVCENIVDETDLRQCQMDVAIHLSQGKGKDG